MFSVSSVNYAPPVQSNLDNGSEGFKYGWKLWSVEGDEAIEVYKPFNYTILLHWFEIPMHFTFVYDGISVSPNKRTLRLLGADCTSLIVSRLSGLRNRITGDDFIRFIAEAIIKVYGFDDMSKIKEFAETLRDRR